MTAKRKRTKAPAGYANGVEHLDGRLVITFALKTVSESNQRGMHFGAKASRVAKQREAAKDQVDVLSAQALPLEVILERATPCRLDDDNLRGALKAVRDGVADALGVKDNDPRVTWAYRQSRSAPKTYQVRIHIGAARPCAHCGAPSTEARL